MTERVRAAVVGVGHLGALHAAKYAATDGAELAGVYDIDPARARDVAATHGCRSFESLAALLGEADCVSVATPTATHREVASAAIALGVEAIGVPVLSDHADIANARLRFDGGCIANVTASRVSLKRERRLRIFQ